MEDKNIRLMLVLHISLICFIKDKPVEDNFASAFGQIQLERAIASALVEAKKLWNFLFRFFVRCRNVGFFRKHFCIKHRITNDVKRCVPYSKF